MIVTAVAPTTGVGVRAGGWFSLCLAFFNASLMLLWFWGNSKKSKFFSALTMPLQSFLALEAASDNQMSMTIAQQKVKVKDSGSTIKRARGALLHILAREHHAGCRSAGLLYTCAEGSYLPQKVGLTADACAGVGIYYCNETSGMPPVMLKSVRVVT